MTTHSHRRHSPGRWMGTCILMLCLPMSATPGGFDEENYARVLRQHTEGVDDVAGTRVAYRDLSNSTAWKKVIESLATFDPNTLDGRAQELAFWINAYNILAIDLVRRNLPLESIRDLGWLLRPVWKKKAGTIGDRAYTLHEIEHKILRPMGDPRIHAALVCASTSCPSLMREPWRAAVIDEQLDREMGTFLADPEKGARFEPAENTLFLSSIFRWFQVDFDAEGGSVAFVRRRLPANVQAQLDAAGDDLEVDFMPYDWSLNALSDGGRQGRMP
ncbi:DUF547 domain-containing protein [Myxococcota bacterium]|nr:DUF547 domain-containing protein [Myxococcota bacterium]